MTTSSGAFPAQLSSFLSPEIRRLAGPIAATVTGQGLMLGGLLCITRFSVHAFGALGFGQYQVARRTLALVAFPLMCGLGVSMPRYIARDREDREKVAGWLWWGGTLAMVLMTAFITLGTCWANQIGSWLFGVEHGEDLVVSLLLASIGMAGYTLVCAALRGLSRFRTAAVLQVINGALVPLVAIALANGRVERSLRITGLLWMASASLSYLRLAIAWGPPAYSAMQALRTIRHLIFFGLPRIPGDVALFGLFAMPAYTAVHRQDIVGAGFVSVGLSLVQAIAAVFASIGFVLLPYWSHAARSTETLQLARRRMGSFVLGSAGVAFMSMVLLQIFLPSLARLLLGSLANAGLHEIRYVVLGAVPFVLYLVLRDFFDAVSVFPLNTLALGAAMLIQFVMLRRRWMSVPVATASSFCVLGLLMVALWMWTLRESGMTTIQNGILPTE